MSQPTQPWVPVVRRKNHRERGAKVQFEQQPPETEESYSDDNTWQGAQDSHEESVVLENAWSGVIPESVKPAAPAQPRRLNVFIDADSFEERGFVLVKAKLTAMLTAAFNTPLVQYTIIATEKSSHFPTGWVGNEQFRTRVMMARKGYLDKTLMLANTIGSFCGGLNGAAGQVVWGYTVVYVGDVTRENIGIFFDLCSRGRHYVHVYGTNNVRSITQPLHFAASANDRFKVYNLQLNGDIGFFRQSLTLPVPIPSRPVQAQVFGTQVPLTRPVPVKRSPLPKPEPAPASNGDSGPVGPTVGAGEASTTAQ